MEQSSSYDEMTIRHQHDRLCKLALDGEAANYHRHNSYRSKHEKTFSELSEAELAEIFAAEPCEMDRCEWESRQFQVLSYDIEVKDSLLAEALQELTEKKRNVILLSYFLDMSDAEIAREMDLVRSTIYEHRKRSLKLLKRILEVSTDEDQ